MPHADEGDVQMIGRGDDPGQVCHYSLIFLNDDLRPDDCPPIVGKDYNEMKDYYIGMAQMKCYRM